MGTEMSTNVFNFVCHISHDIVIILYSTWYTPWTGPVQNETKSTELCQKSPVTTVDVQYVAL